MAANLETLELTINGNAEGAKQGIDNLILSLSHLSDALVKPYSDLRDFNAELKKLKDMGKIKFTITGTQELKTVEKTTKAIEKGVKAPAESVPGMKEYTSELQKQTAEIQKQAKVEKEKITAENFRSGAPKATPEIDREIYEFQQTHYKRNPVSEQNNRASVALAREKQETADLARVLMESSSKVELMNSRLEAMKQAYIDNARKGELNNQQLAEGALRIQKLESDIQKTIKAEEELAHQSDNTKSALERLKEGAKNSTEGVSKLWNRIKRIAGNMLIRTGIRALVKDVREGINNLYEWSKLNKGEFGKSVDAMRAKALQLKNSIGAAIAPVIQAAIPVIRSLASAAIKAFNYINQLISLLAGKSTWTAAVENIENTTDAVNSGASAAKDWLASFDELNVMNSDSGGGGGGANTTEYENMFQEMNTFDQKIRDLVKWIKENMESIKGIAIAIGTAILAWKVAEAFSGIISTLAGLVAAGAVIGLTVQATWMLTGQYLQTGEVGWLLTEMFTTAVGSWLAGLIANAFIGEGTGVAAASITLALSALVGISVLLGDTNVDAVSPEGIAVAAENALKIGVAAGLLINEAGLGTATAIGGGAAAALAVFGVVIGLKTLVQSRDSDKITEKDLKGLALSSLSGGLAAGLAAFIFVKNSTIAASLGFGAAVTAVNALVMAGILVGIKASVEVQKTQEITAATLGKDALASIMTGTGLAVAAGLMGAGGIAVLAVGGTAAVLTFAILLGVQGYLTKEKIGLQWGDVELSSEDIETFVNNKMFRINVQATIDKINTRVSDVQAAQKSVNDALLDVLQESKVIKLGINEESSAENLAGKVKTLVGEVQSLCDAEMESLKLTFATMRIVDGTGNDISAETLEAGLQGWGDVKDNIFVLGQKISDELEKGYTDGVANFDEEMVKSMLLELEQASQALSHAQITGPELTNFSIDLSSLSENSGKEVIRRFQEMKSNIESAYRSSIEQSISSLRTLSEYYYSMNNPELGAMYKDLADQMRAGMEQSIDDAVNAASESGAEEIRNWITKSIGNGLEINSDSEEWRNRIEEFGGNLSDAIGSAVVSVTGNDEILDVAAMINMTGWDLLEEKAKKNLIKALGGLTNTDTINRLKEELNVSAAEIIQLSDWNSFSSDQQVQFLKSLKDAYGSKDALEAAKAAGIDVGKAISEGLESNDSEIQRIAQEMSDEFSNQNPEMNVDANLPKSEVTEVTDAITNGAKPTVTADAVMPKDQVTEVSDAITNGAKPTVTADAVMPQEQVTEVAEAVTNGAKPTVTADALMPEAEVTEMTNAIQNGSKPVVTTDAVMPETEITEVTDAVQNGAKPQVNTSLLLNKKAIKDYKKKVTDKVKPEIPSKLQNVTDENMKEWKTNVEKNKVDIATKLKLPTKAELNDQITGQGYDPTISVKTKVEEAILKRMKEQIESVNASVIADIKAKDSNSAVIDSFKKAMINAINRINVNLLTGGGMSLGNVHLEARRKGGLVNSGDMFIANEDGTPELIAKFGNQTAVANTDQMVDAMARGVQYANESQNALLAEQNSLLRAILNKENSVRLGASAALGRIARQSLDMYGAAMGV